MTTRKTRTWAAAGAAATLAILATGGAAAHAGPTLPAGPAPIEGTTFTTQDGSASFTLPAGWSVRDESGERSTSGESGEWVNDVALLDAEGDVRATYLDSIDGIGGVAPDETKSVTTLPPRQDGLGVSSWWERNGEGFTPLLAIDDAADADLSPYVSNFYDADEGLFSFQASFGTTTGCTANDSAELVEACLMSAEVTETTAVLESFELHDTRQSE